MTYAKLICPKCKSQYDDLDYRYCPKCASELVDEIYCNIVSIMEHFKLQRGKCKNCNKFFNADFKYCPFCSQELVIEDVFTIDNENRLVTGKWNDDLKSVSFEELHYQLSLNSDPPIISFVQVFDSKERWDKEFNRFLKNSTEKLSMLTFDEVYQLLSCWALPPSGGHRNIIGFKTLDLIKEEYGISNIKFHNEVLTIIDNDTVIEGLELRKRKLYYLIEGVDIDDDW